MRRLYYGIFLMAMTTLMMEVVLTRAFDVILGPGMAYMVITCAMLCFGLAGIYAALRPFPDAALRGILAVLAAGFAVASLALRPILNFLPFDYDMLTTQPIIQLLSFFGMYVALALPFFFAGLIFTVLFSSYASRIQTLYFWDLIGAGLGCIALVPMITPIGPGGILMCTAGLALFSSALFSERRAWSLATSVAGILLFVVPFVRSPEYFEFSGHLQKRGVIDAAEEGRIAFTRWDPISKIQVIRPERTRDGEGGVEAARPFVERKHIAYDGGTQSSYFYPFDGDFAKLRRGLESGNERFENHFWFAGVTASHYHMRDRAYRALIIGSAGGQETVAALTFGAEQVDAIEMVGAVIDLGKDRYAEFTGNIFNHPKVNVIRAEGRSFLRAKTGLYDVIQIFSNHTSSSVGSGSGAMSASYLLTVEAFREYFEHLAADGILHVNHHVYPRIINTAALTWKKMGRRDFRSHVVVFEKETGSDHLPTILVKMNPWTRAEVAELESLLKISEKHEHRNLSWRPQVLSESPFDREASFLSEAFYSGEFPESLADRMKYRVTPITDGNPYFNFLRKTFKRVEPNSDEFVNRATASILNGRTRRFVPMDIVHLIVTGVVSLFFAGIFILVPLRFSNLGKFAWPHKTSALVYFACLGSGFIIIELILIQVFMKLIGFPLYTVSVVLLAMLISAGIGSLSSARLGIGVAQRWSWPYIGIAIVGALLLGGYSNVFQMFLASPVLIRCAVSFVMIFPLGFFLGMPFPLGILCIEKMPKGAVAWGWAMNGLFTLIGGLASVVLSIFLGFQMTLLIGLAIYGVAYLMLLRMRECAVPV